MNAGEVDSTPYPSHQEPIPKGAHTKLPCSKTHINLKKSTFESVNATRHIFITLAVLIFLGHSFVPHTHEDEGHDEGLHQHNEEHNGLGDLIACFFQVDHESEDLDNFFSPDLNPSITPNGYAVIPQTYFVQKPLAFESVVPSAPTLGTHFLRGPPLA
jgi:hypothetical protein